MNKDEVNDFISDMVEGLKLKAELMFIQRWEVFSKEAVKLLPASAAYIDQPTKEWIESCAKQLFTSGYSEGFHQGFETLTEELEKYASKLNENQ